MSSPPLTELNPVDLAVGTRFLMRFGYAAALSYCVVQSLSPRRGLMTCVKFDVLDGPQSGESFEKAIAELCVYQKLYHADTLH